MRANTALGLAALRTGFRARLIGNGADAKLNGWRGFVGSNAVGLLRDGGISSRWTPAVGTAGGGTSHREGVVCWLAGAELRLVSAV